LVARELQALEVLELGLFDVRVPEIGAADLLEFARRVEAAAIGYDARIKHSMGGECEINASTTVYATSNGFVGGVSKSLLALAVSVVAENDGGKSHGNWFCYSRTADGLDPPEAIGIEAARRALQGLDARTVPYQSVPVVFEQRMSVRFMRDLAAALSGVSIAQGRSFLVGQMGEVVASKLLTLEDDPFIRGGLGSASFGDEGLALQRRTLIQDGRLASYLLDAKSARMLNTDPNGGAPTNLIIKAGSHSPQEIIAMVPNGLYLTNVMGYGVDVATGRYSMAASGVWIENGQLTFAVNGITVSSTMQEMLAGVEAVGNDCDFKRGSFVAPTMLIREMKVGSTN
jgi:PmbA protein